MAVRTTRWFVVAIVITLSMAHAQERGKWVPANYQGLVIGKSTAKDMRRILGKPQSIDFPEGDPPSGPKRLTWNQYRVMTPVPGRITIVTNPRGLIVEAFLDDLGGAGKDAVVRWFGPDYDLVKYAFDTCLREGDSAPIYQSSGGQLTKLEYPRKGIAVSINDAGSVLYVSYLDHPPGPATSKCGDVSTQHHRNKRNP